MFLKEPNKEDILRSFPSKIKLSYENMEHKKVCPYDFIIAIPDGLKKFVWFTKIQNQPSFIILEIKFNSREKQIENFQIIPYTRNEDIMNKSLFEGFGTILYGTLVNLSSLRKKDFFSIEDVFYYKGKNMMYTKMYEKLSFYKNILNDDLNKLSFIKNERKLCFCLPIMKTNLNEIIQIVKSLSYKVIYIQYRSLNETNHHFSVKYMKYSKILFSFSSTQNKQNINNNSINNYTHINNNNNNPYHNLIFTPFRISNAENVSPLSLKTPSKVGVSNEKWCKKHLHKEFIFQVKPDIQNDIYHLYAYDDTDKRLKLYDVAYIPDYKTSVMMNRLFRNIKENQNLDSLEESDDEEEFQNQNLDKFVFLERNIPMICVYHYKFKKWIPIRCYDNLIDFSKIIRIHELNQNEKK